MISGRFSTLRVGYVWIYAGRLDRGTDIESNIEKNREGRRLDITVSHFEAQAPQR